MLFALQFCTVVIRLKLHQTLEVKNYFKQENIMLQLTFNSRLLTLTNFPGNNPVQYVNISISIT